MEGYHERTSRHLLSLLLLFFFLTWVMKLDRSLSVKVSNISWFPGGDNDDFSLPFQHGYTLLKFKICFYYDLFRILFYFAIFSTISLVSLSFFFRLYYTLLSPNENAGSSHTSNNAFLGVLFRSSYVRMSKVQYDFWYMGCSKKWISREYTIISRKKKFKKWSRFHKKEANFKLRCLYPGFVIDLLHDNLGINIALLTFPVHV